MATTIVLDESKGPGKAGYLTVDGRDRSDEAFRTVAMPVGAPAYRGAGAGPKPAVAWLGGDRIYDATVLRQGELFGTVPGWSPELEEFYKQVEADMGPPPR